MATARIETRNRIEEKVLAYEKRIASSGRTPAELADLNLKMANSFSDHAQFQELKSHAQMQGILTLDEAMTVYSILGEFPTKDGWASGASLAQKITVSQLMGELLGVTAKGKGRAA